MPSHRADTPPQPRSRAERKELERRSAQGAPGSTRRSRNAAGENARSVRSAPRVTTQRAQLSPLSVPQVGIVGALGLATIAAPLSGALAAPPATVAVKVSSSVSLADPQFPLLALHRTAVDDLRLVPDDSAPASVPTILAAPRNLLVTRASRGSERSVLPGCDGTFVAVTAANGELPSKIMCTLWDAKHQLRSDAAVAFAKLNVAYSQHFGHPICITDTYRTLSAQYAVKAQRGGFAATPGLSKHGWAIAADLCDGMNTANTNYWWMRANAPSYGWDNPAWARSGGSGAYEPWHWEYLSGEVGANSGD